MPKAPYICSSRYLNILSFGKSTIFISMMSRPTELFNPSFVTSTSLLIAGQWSSSPQVLLRWRTPDFSKKQKNNSKLQENTTKHRKMPTQVSMGPRNTWANQKRSWTINVFMTTHSWECLEVARFLKNRKFIICRPRMPTSTAQVH